LLAAQGKGLKITPARAGESIISSGNLRAEILAPVGSSYNNLNDWSAVIKIQYGQKSFLLTGDAEEYSEAEMLRASRIKLKSTVLKVGHHGSNSSTSPAFLKAVDPDYAVISVGQGNDYGHPHQQTLQALAGVDVYRTDLNGTIVFETDGQTITVQKQQNTIEPRAPDTTTPIAQAKYIGNKNSKIFHKETCSSLPATQNRVLFKNKDEAIKQGYRPCQRCNP
jgi:competence protein ComEC